MTYYDETDEDMGSAICEYCEEVYCTCCGCDCFMDYDDVGEEND